MITHAVRSKLFDLRHQREAATRTRELIDRRREVLLRALLERTVARDRQRSRVAADLTAARLKLRLAAADVGALALDSAALAQPAAHPIDARRTATMGVSLLVLQAAFEPFRPRYAPAGSALPVDSAGEAFAALLPAIVALVQEEAAVRNLERGLRKTLRLLNALEKVVLPDLHASIRAVIASIEEEERDDGLRRRRQLALR